MHPRFLHTCAGSRTGPYARIERPRSTTCNARSTGARSKVGQRAGTYIGQRCLDDGPRRQRSRRSVVDPDRPRRQAQVAGRSPADGAVEKSGLGVELPPRPGVGGAVVAKHADNASFDPYAPYPMIDPRGGAPASPGSPKG